MAPDASGHGRGRRGRRLGCRVVGDGPSVPSRESWPSNADSVSSDPASVGTVSSCGPDASGRPQPARARRPASASRRATVSRIESGSVVPQPGAARAHPRPSAGCASASSTTPASRSSRWRADRVRDNAGRRFPAHLDVEPPDEVPPPRLAVRHATTARRPGAGTTSTARATDRCCAAGAPSLDARTGPSRPRDELACATSPDARSPAPGRAPPRPEVVCECLGVLRGAPASTSCPVPVRAACRRG